MAAVGVVRTATGAEWRNGHIDASAEASHVEKSQVRAVLTVIVDGAIAYRDPVNLTSAKARAHVVKALADDGIELESGVLLALETACREPAPVDGGADDEPSRDPPPALGEVLDGVVAYLRRYIAFAADAQADAVALWTAHSHALRHADTSPILAITSPEKRSGKTRLMDVLEHLVARPWRAILPSEAVVFRKIAADSPTLLLDEVDAIFGARTAPQHEGLRALLNAGNRRGVTVPRCVGEGTKMVVEEFSVFGAKAVAAIGDLPDTIADRSIPIRLRRRARDEHVERFRYAAAKAQAAPLHDALAHHGKTLDLASARPDIPEELDDRAADGWEPLLAIADAAGGDWPQRARAAALALHGGPLDDDSLGVRLLADLRSIFEQRGRDRAWTEELLGDLNAIEESPWGDLRGRPLGAHALARLLRPFGAAPRLVRVGELVKRGYQIADLEDAFARYLGAEKDAEEDEEGTENVSPPPPSESLSDRYTVTEGGSQVRFSGSNQPGCNDVTDVTAPGGGAGEEKNAVLEGREVVEL